MHWAGWRCCTPQGARSAHRLKRRPHLLFRALRLDMWNWHVSPGRRATRSLLRLAVASGGDPVRYGTPAHDRVRRVRQVPRGCGQERLVPRDITLWRSCELLRRCRSRAKLEFVYENGKAMSSCHDLGASSSPSSRLAHLSWCGASSSAAASAWPGGVGRRRPAVCDAKGELLVKPFPSMPTRFWNDEGDARYRAAYFSRFPGVWRHGDYAELTAHDGVIIHGRSDAVLNPGGVRIGTGEIYRVVEQIDEVLESIVIAQEWEHDVRIVLRAAARRGVIR